MTTTSTEVLIEREGSITHVTLARPEKSNALSATLVEALHEVLSNAEGDGTTLMTFHGQGANFCSGFDLGNLDSQSDGDLVLKLIRIEMLLQRVAHAPFSTLALAHGKVLGAGCDLFCSCSERVAAPNASFRMPGWRFGIALGTRRLVARIGIDAARSVLLTSRLFAAAEAKEIGFATQLAEQSEWPSITSEVAKRAALLEPVSQALLLSLTMPDTRSVDLAALVQSAGVPGLKERIAQYRAAEKAGRVSHESIVN